MLPASSGISDGLIKTNFISAREICAAAIQYCVAPKSVIELNDRRRSGVSIQSVTEAARGGCRLGLRARARALLLAERANRLRARGYPSMLKPDTCILIVE